MTNPPTPHALRGNPPPPALDLNWAGARQKIATAENYLIASVRPDGAPHVVPVLGVWLDEMLFFNTDHSARKAKNLLANPAIAATSAGSEYDFTVEGTARVIVDDQMLRQVAAAFPVKYTWWHPTVRDGAFYADDSDEPRLIFGIAPRHVLGFGKASGFSATRWTFAT